jgi:WD40 repeat protein
MRNPSRHHVRSIAFAPDGARLAVGALDGSVTLWRRDGSQHGEPLRGHANAVTAVAFNRDGTRLASAGVDDTVRLWNPADGSAAGLLPRRP